MVVAVGASAAGKRPNLGAKYAAFCEDQINGNYAPSPELFKANHLQTWACTCPPGKVDCGWCQTDALSGKRVCARK
jgi:hypothetical protein